MDYILKERHMTLLRRHVFNITDVKEETGIITRGLRVLYREIKNTSYDDDEYKQRLTETLDILEDVKNKIYDIVNDNHLAIVGLIGRNDP